MNPSDWTARLFNQPDWTPAVMTQCYAATSLDGFIATLDDSLEWLFRLGDIGETSYPEFIRHVGALAMGSATYEWMLPYVVGPEAPRPGQWPYDQPVWVFTTRLLPAVPGADTRFARGDVRPIHEAMLREADGKNVWIVGGGDLVPKPAQRPTDSDRTANAPGR